MKIIKLQIILLFSLMLAVMACSDDKNSDETNVPQVTSPLPGVDTPQIAGNEITIEGNGFNEGCEIELRKEADARTTARTITVIPKKVTPTSIIFIIPEGIDGVFAIVIKQDNKEYVIGKIAVKSNLSGAWKWEESYVGGELQGTHQNQYFVLNTDGSGYYQDENEKKLYTWTLEGKTIKIDYENKETLEVAITNINAGELKISYVEDGKEWSEYLTKYTGIISFDKPEAITLDAIEVTDHEAICRGQFETKADKLTYGVCYSQNNKNPEAKIDQTVTASSADGDNIFQIALKELPGGTTFYYRAFLIVNNKTYYGEAKSFTTISVKTLECEKNKETAICSGQYLSSNGLPSEYGICYSTSEQSPTTSDKKSISTNIDAEGLFSATIAQLESEATYYYRAYSVIGDNTYYGDTKLFKTERSFPIGTWKQVLLEITDKYNGQEDYTSSERNFIFIYLESGKMGTLDSAGKLIIDDKSSYSYDETSQTLTSSYYDTEDKEMNTETGKVTFIENGFKLTINTKYEDGEITAVSTYIKQPDAEGTY